MRKEIQKSKIFSLVSQYMYANRKRNVLGVLEKYVISLKYKKSITYYNSDYVVF